MRALLYEAQTDGWSYWDLDRFTINSDWLFVLRTKGVYQLVVLFRPKQPAYNISTRYLGPACRANAVISFPIYWLMLPWWVYLDARPRSDKAAPLAVFVLLTNFLGWLTYLVIRPEAERLCPVCVELMKPSYRCCPHCGWTSQARCGQCGRPARSDWRICPYCEARLGDAGAGAREVEVA